MSNTVWRLAGVSVNGTLIPVSQSTLDPEVEAASEGTGISFSPVFVAAMQQGGMLRVSSPAIDAVLTALGSGQAVAVGTVILYFGKLAATGYASGSVHQTYTIGDGLVVLRRVAGDGSRPVMAELEILSIRDGSNEPVVVAGSQALPSGTALGHVYDIGPLLLGDALVSTRNLDWSPNIEVARERLSGDSAHCYAAVVQQRPEIRAGVVDLAVSGAAIPSVEAEESGFFLRKMDLGGTRVAAATEEHIFVSIPLAMASADSTGGAWGAVAESGVVLRPVYDGTNAIYSVDLTAAIAVPT